MTSRRSDHRHALSLERIIPAVWRLDITPVQRAICRASDGLPLGDLWDRQDVQETFGSVCPEPTRPSEMVVCAAIRTGKTIFVSAMALKSAITCDISPLAPGEMPRVPVLSTTAPQAKQAFGFIREAAATLNVLISERADELLVRHQSGLGVEIKVTAGSRAGANIVSRWLAGVVFDEFTLMTGSDDSVVNLDDAVRQTKKRMLPGAQIGYVGSPHAPFGPGYDMITAGYGKPTSRRVVAWGLGPDMNPGHYPQSEVKRLLEHDPEIHRITCMRAFLDPETSYISPGLVDACRVLSGDVEPIEGHHYVAAMDPATRGNAWTLVVLGTRGIGSYYVARARQWMPRGKPLQPGGILREIAELVAPYGTAMILTDQHQFEAMQDLAEQHGIGLADNRVDPDSAYPQLLQLISLKRLELPQCDYIRRDLIGIKRRPTQKGITYKLATTRGDGRHSDYIPSILHCLSQPAMPPALIEHVTEADEIERADLEAIQSEQDASWRDQAYRTFTS